MAKKNDNYYIFKVKDATEMTGYRDQNLECAVQEFGAVTGYDDEEIERIIEVNGNVATHYGPIEKSITWEVIKP